MNDTRDPDDIRRMTLDEMRLWHELCRELQALGVVTQADLDSPVGADDTRGQRLLRRVRAWGDANAELLGAELE